MAVLELYLSHLDTTLPTMHIFLQKTKFLKTWLTSRSSVHLSLAVSYFLVYHFHHFPLLLKDG